MSQNNNDHLQYYPTSESLATIAWNKFQNKNIVRLLEPSAGAGDLVKIKAHQSSRYSSKCHYDFEWDAIELDVEHHTNLRASGATIVGYDFLSHGDCSIYSHIIMNPPFAQGAKHVMHAWNTLFDGEIVAIVNAETVRNPHSRERQLLLNIIESYGSVEFIKNAFLGVDVKRKADVDVALIHLIKRAPKSELVGNVLKGLKKDDTDGSDLGQINESELIVPADIVQRSVLEFNLAVSAAKEAAIATVRANIYAKRVGRASKKQTHAGANELEQASELAPKGIDVQALFYEQYLKLKESAWLGILECTEVTSKLSSDAASRFQSEFKNITALEFNKTNIYGFLQGLAQNAGEIQMGMVCDVFDVITRYHSENTVYYMGWKSNDAHRTAGMRIKNRRFIIPNTNGFSDISWQALQMLRDFDRVFAMLDGKTSSDNGLCPLFENKESMRLLKEGERLSTDYFDVRYYPGVGTIHFFPRNKEVIERLNRVVGQYRKWLPESMEQASKDFTWQYEKAETLHKEILDKFKKTRGSNWCKPNGLSSKNSDVHAEVNKLISSAIEKVLTARGVDPFGMIKSNKEQLLLGGCDV